MEFPECVGKGGGGGEGGGVVVRPKHIKDMYEAYLEFPEGTGTILDEEVWIFSQTTHSSMRYTTVCTSLYSQLSSKLQFRQLEVIKRDSWVVSIFTSHLSINSGRASNSDLHL